jgi:hypothetical protein
MSYALSFKLLAGHRPYTSDADGIFLLGSYIVGKII